MMVTVCSMDKEMGYPMTSEVNVFRERERERERESGIGQKKKVDPGASLETNEKTLFLSLSLSSFEHKRSTCKVHRNGELWRPFKPILPWSK